MRISSLLLKLGTAALVISSLACVGVIEGEAPKEIAIDNAAAPRRTEPQSSSTTTPPASEPAAPPVTEEPAPPAVPTDGWMTVDQKRRADQLVSLFENSTIVIQYDYVVALGDGRGYTAGRGFTTGTRDLLQVVELFTVREPGNALAPFLPRLRELAKSWSGSTTGLVGFPAAWAATAKSSALFRKTQDDVVDVNVYLPAMKRADSIGLKTALARAVIYDTVVMHGDGPDPDGTLALMKATEAVVGTPKTGTDESVWLKKFLAVRRADLVHANDAETRAVWAEAVGRVDVFIAIDAAGNYGLTGPIVVKHPDYAAIVP